MTHLETKAPEEGHYTITASASVAPTALYWALADEDGTAINSRTSEAVTSPSTASAIDLDGDDLQITNRKKLRRWFTVWGTYSGGAKSISGECTFDIEPFKGIT